ncbi:MAG: L-serine ammonia-lyase, iron-sulfur-dependent, subunit alpha [Eubacteriales bacterium]
MENKEILNILEKELVVALGCTEPIAIAYAAAVATKYLCGEKILSIDVLASGNVLKNALAVNIPGAGGSGINLAAALGSLAEDIEKRMELLSGITVYDVQRAKTLINDGIVRVKKAETDKKLYIEVIVENSQTVSRVVIEDIHTNITLIEVNGERKNIDNIINKKCKFIDDTYPILSLPTIWKFISEVKLDELSIIKESIRLNTNIALEGLSGEYGLMVGKILSKPSLGQREIDFSTYAMAMTSAASDARMAGSNLPAMSNTGSGNQGISATLPVVAIGEKIQASSEQIIRAVTLSNLITIYIKSKFGRLSALCGVTISATGASCGIAYLLGGGLPEIKSSIQNMMGNITGMLCDGAKLGCALKVATCTNAAIQSAIIAMEGVCIQSTDGIIEDDPDMTILNMCSIGNLGTSEADRIILEIMLRKANS